jgi:hypothetical protein
MELLPWEINLLATRKLIKLSAFDRVNDFDRFAGRRYEIEPSASRDTQCSRIEFKNSVGQRVGPTKIVEEPAVESGRAEG